MKKRVFLFLLLPLFLSACATVLNTTTQQIEIESTPPHAKIYVDNQKFGATPQTLNLDRKNDHVIRLELDGYEVYETQITRKLDSKLYWNASNGFLPGIIIDYFFGGMYDLVPEKSTIELQLLPKPPEKPKR